MFIYFENNFGEKANVQRFRYVHGKSVRIYYYMICICDKHVDVIIHDKNIAYNGSLSHGKLVLCAPFRCFSIHILYKYKHTHKQDKIFLFKYVLHSLAALFLLRRCWVFSILRKLNFQNKEQQQKNQFFYFTSNRKWMVRHRYEKLSWDRRRWKLKCKDY